ncbi:hypothetical protein GCM10010421_46590 [Streptomyces glaucus]|uniref:Aminoglycoside phosphotransferase domain-containing protein n=1 Tax=Streptomyces glaucus TaxID=284029 RepID=A0ABN3K469_9ACTN
MRQLVEEFGTGYQRTAVYRTDSGYLWVRSPGPDRPGGMVEPGPELRTALTAHTPRGMALRLAEKADESLVYRVKGCKTAARVALGRQGGADQGERLASAAHAVGRSLAGLHADVPVTAAEASPPALSRVIRWMSTGQGPRGAAALHGVLHAHLGPARWRRILRWCQEFAEPGHADTVLLHGAPSLGSVILASEGAADCLLTGEEVSRGAAGYDVGWLVGEILEWDMTASAPENTAKRAAARHVGRALLGGYGALPDATVVSRAAVLRVLTHAHDFAAYRGWHPELTHYARSLSRLVDETRAGKLLAFSGLL